MAIRNTRKICRKSMKNCRSRLKQELLPSAIKLIIKKTLELSERLEDIKSLVAIRDSPPSSRSSQEPLGSVEEKWTRV